MMRQSFSTNPTLPRRWMAVLAGIILLACSGCYPVPVRFPTRTTTMSAEPIDLRLVKPGSTTRDEIAKELGSVSTNAATDDFFWGRLRVSKYRQIMMVGYVPVGPGDRMWGVQNLLVAYDQRGLVKNWTLVGDGKLLEQLNLLNDAASPPLGPAPLVLQNSVVYRVHEKHAQGGTKRTADLTLRPSRVECFGITVARSDLRTITLSNSNDSEHLSLKMLFNHSIDYSQSPLHRKTDRLDLSVDPQSLMLFRRYMKQAAAIN
jgi:hypothetical protein